MRTKHQLTPIELAKFNRLPPYQGEAIAFWKWIAKTRNLDSRSIVSTGQNFTALPVGHGKHFCYPLSLKCKKKPVYAD